MINKLFILLDRIKHSSKAKKIIHFSIAANLFLYVFSIPSFANRVGFNFICYLLVALLIVLLAFYIYVFNLPKKFDKRLLLILFFIISSLIGTISFSHQFRGLLTLVLLATSMFAIYLAMLIIGNNDLIFKILILAFFIFAIYYLIHYRKDILNYASYNYDEFRLGWDFENPNTVGSFMTLALSLSVYMVLFKTGKIRFIYLAPALSFLLVGLTTGSRTFMVSLFVIAICFVLFKFKKHIWIASLVLVVIIAISVLLINTLPFLETIKYRIDDTLNIFSNGVASGSTLERILWQRYGYYLASRRIFFGFGESGFAIASGVKTYTHGNFTEMLCDFGLVGFLIFYCFNLEPAFVSLFSKKEYKEYIFTIIMVMLINGFLSVYYYDKCTYVIMAFCYYLLDCAEPELIKKQMDFKHFKEVTI